VPGIYLCAFLIIDLHSIAFSLMAEDIHFRRAVSQLLNSIKYIAQRKSVRSYSSKEVAPELLAELKDYMAQLNTGPFGAGVRFKLLDLEPLDQNELRSLGTYGFIRGARHYMMGAVKQDRGAFEDLGYCFEKLVLKATALGLGTCWLGGTFRRGAFAAKMNLDPGELLPVISPLGYAAEEPTSAEKMVRAGAGSARRKPWSELFFMSDGKTPLSGEKAGPYGKVLEAVRLGPSASNKQPWRVVQGSEKLYHFYLKENKIYNRMLGKIRLQLIDMGIAICHFDLAATELNLQGRWHFDEPQINPKGLLYVASWLS